jgi:hypothetical protein
MRGQGVSELVIKLVSKLAAIGAQRFAQVTAGLSMLAACMLTSTQASAQVTAPPLPSTPAHPGWVLPASKAPRPLPHAMEQVRRDAGQMAPAITHAEARRLLLGTSWLPVMDPVLLYTSTGGLSVDVEQWQELSPSLRGGLGWKAALHDSYAIYFPRWNSPIWSVRPADVFLQSAGTELAERGAAAFASAAASEKPELAQIADELGTKPTPDKPLRGQHLLVAQEDSFVLAYLLAGQGAHVTLVLRASTPLVGVLQAQPQWQGEVRGHGMGENVAPGGSLRIVRASSGADPRAWLRDASVAGVLAEQVREHGPVTAALVIEGEGAAAPGLLREQFGGLDALARTLAEESAKPDSREPQDETLLFVRGAPVVWYAMATTKAGSDSLRLAVQGEDGHATSDDEAMRTIARSLDWTAGNQPVVLDEVSAWWWRGEAQGAW